MAKNKNTGDENLAKVEGALNKSEQFIENNQQNLTRGFIIVIAIILLIYGYKKYVTEPKNKTAHSEMFKAEYYFSTDSFNLALNGDGQYLGFLDVIDNYGKTEAGNLAHFYTGICYLNMKEFDNAINYLKKFNSEDEIFYSRALGCIGDAYRELKNKEKAIDFYIQAGNYNENNYTSPIYLMQAADILEDQNDFKKALEIYELIKEKYPESQEGSQIDKYIAKAKGLLEK